MWLLKRFWDKPEQPDLNIKVAAYAVEGVMWLALGYAIGHYIFQLF